MEQEQAINEVENMDSLSLPVGIEKSELVEYVKYLVEETSLSPREAQAYSIKKICGTKYFADLDDEYMLYKELGIQDNKHVLLDRAEDKVGKAKKLSGSIDHGNPKKELARFTIGGRNGLGRAIVCEIVILNYVRELEKYSIKINKYTDGLQREYLGTDVVRTSEKEAISDALDLLDQYNSNVNKKILKRELENHLGVKDHFQEEKVKYRFLD